MSFPHKRNEKKMKLSLVIPCYNESANLPLLLNRFEELDKFEKNIEIIIVDNGSTDNTKIVLDKLAPRFSFIKRVSIKKNQGYGHGILIGLQVASGEILAWTHADMQTDPNDAIHAINFFKKKSHPEKLFVKGRRYGRSITEVFFTTGMALFEILLLKRFMWDINAQPTMFHKKFFNTWILPPDDFSLDLYAYYMAKKKGLEVLRFPVRFGKRAHGISHWNISLTAKYRFIKRTLTYSFALYKRMKKNA